MWASEVKITGVFFIFSQIVGVVFVCGFAWDMRVDLAARKPHIFAIFADHN